MHLKPRLLIVAVVALLAVVGIPAANAALSPSVAQKIAPNLTAALEQSPAKVGVIVQFASRPTAADLTAMRQAGFLPGLVRYSVVDAVYGEAPASAIKSLARNPRVTYLEHDAVIPWTDVEANEAGRVTPVHDANYVANGETNTGGFTGRGVGIAIVDSGIDARHPDLLWKPLAEAQGLPAKTIANYKIVGRDSVEISAELPPLDEALEANQLAIDTVNSDATGGHGTHVAGIAAGSGSGDSRFTGVAPGANLIGYGAGDTLVVHSGLAALDHIHLNHDELGIQIVNNSWGGAGEWDAERAVTKAVRKLANEDGLVMIFAAGNSGGDGTTLESSVWGNIPEVIQVANYYDKRGWLDDTSSRGLKDREDTWPDLSAPGTQIVSTAAAGGPVTIYGSTQDALIARLNDSDEPYVVSAPTGGAVDQDVNGQHVIVGDYASMTGTSMAAPYIAGVAALMLEANPSLTWPEVRDVLRATANQPAGRTYVADGFAMGTGLVDAAEAVAVALKMGEGLSLADALQNASLDLTSSPAVINGGEGPVTDNSIPGAPAVTSLVSGNPQMFHGSAIDLSIATGDPMFVPGEPIGFAVRNVQSNDSAQAPVSADNVEAWFVILKDGVQVGGPFTPEVETTTAVDGSSFGLTYSYDWTIPSDYLGTYEWQTWTLIKSTGTSYLTSTLPFHVGAGAAG